MVDPNEYGKARRAKKKELGICYSCSKPARPGKTRCEACSKRGMRYKSEAIKRAELAGLCTCCHKKPSDPFRNTCYECRSKRKKYNILYDLRRSADQKEQ